MNSLQLQLYYTTHSLLASIWYYSRGEISELDHKYLMEIEIAKIQKLLDQIKEGE